MSLNILCAQHQQQQQQYHQCDNDDNNDDSEPDNYDSQHGLNLNFFTSPLSSIVKSRNSESNVNAERHYHSCFVSPNWIRL